MTLTLELASGVACGCTVIVILSFPIRSLSVAKYVFCHISHLSDRLQGKKYYEILIISIILHQNVTSIAMSLSFMTRCHVLSSNNQILVMKIVCVILTWFQTMAKRCASVPLVVTFPFHMESK